MYQYKHHSQLRVLEFLAHFPILSAIDTAAQPHSGRCRFLPSLFLCRHNATISWKVLLIHLALPIPYLDGQWTAPLGPHDVQFT